MLPLWERTARYLREWGYAVWTGVLSSERYGVPQTRKRAILMASLDGPVHPPRPTHQSYVPGEPARHEQTLEGELLPWVSMADALRWSGGVRDSFGPPAEDYAGRAASRVKPATTPAPVVDTKARDWVRVMAAMAKDSSGGGATRANHLRSGAGEGT